MAIAVFCFGTAACQASEYPQTSEKAAPLFGTLWGLEQIDSYNQTFSPANEPLDSDYLETGIDYTVQFITELDGKLLCEIKTICGNCVGLLSKPGQENEEVELACAEEECTNKKPGKAFFTYMQTMEKYTHSVSGLAVDSGIGFEFYRQIMIFRPQN